MLVCSDCSQSAADCQKPLPSVWNSPWLSEESQIRLQLMRLINCMIMVTWYYNMQCRHTCIANAWSQKEVSLITHVFWHKISLAIKVTLICYLHLPVWWYCNPIFISSCQSSCTCCCCTYGRWYEVWRCCQFYPAVSFDSVIIFSSKIWIFTATASLHQSGTEL